MTIYEIDSAIAALLDGAIDEETGEVMFDDALNDKLQELNIAREEKIENCALAYKQYMAEVAAIKAEKKFLCDPLDRRLKHLEASATRAAAFLEYALGGETFKTAKVNISYSKSESTEYDEEFLGWAKEHDAEFPGILTPQEPKISKTEVKKYIKKGANILHAWLASGKMKIE